MASKFLKIHPKDNVYVALTDLRNGERITDTLTLADDVPAKHKFLDKPLGADEEVIMYGGVVGKAMQPIAAGGVIGTHNIKHKATPYSGKTKQYSWTPPDVSKWKNKTFMGYHRADGQVGTANYWLVVPLVFCENRNVDVLKQAFIEELGFGKPDIYKEYVHDLVRRFKEGEDVKDASLNMKGIPTSSGRVFQNIDGVKFLSHQGGCGGTRQDSETLCALIAGYIHNPNVAGATADRIVTEKMAVTRPNEFKACDHSRSATIGNRNRVANPGDSKNI